MGSIGYQSTGRVARLIIDNPSARNGVTWDMADALRGHIETAVGDPEVRVIALSGRGDHFCAGADLRASAEMVGMSEDEIEAVIRERMHPVVSALVACPKPTVAVIRGACVGIGLSYALACDLRLAASDASLGLVFTRIGLHPDGGSSYLLPRLVGTGVALEMMLLGDRVSGDVAAARGLVNRSLPPEALAAAAEDWIARLAAGPPLAYRFLKANVRFAEGSTLEQALDQEARTQAYCLRSQDAMRGVAAFFSRSAPVFEGN